MILHDHWKITQSMTSLISPCNASNCPAKRIPLPYLDCLPSHFLHFADEFSLWRPLPRNNAVMRSFAEKGAHTVQSPREVAEASDVIITMLPSSPHVCSFPFFLSLCLSHSLSHLLQYHYGITCLSSQIPILRALGVVWIYLPVLKRFVVFVFVMQLPTMSDGLNSIIHVLCAKILGWEDDVKDRELSILLWSVIPDLGGCTVYNV